MITAGHLMAMRHLGAMPEGLYNMNVHAGRRLRELQTNYNFFQIKLAQKLYNDLRQRSGDLKPGKNLKTGEVVLMAEPTTPSHTWRLARVTETFPGKDGYVRVVEILDANKKEFLRSVRQLVKLPVAGAEEDKELSPTRAAMTKPPDNPPTNPSPANSQHPTAGPRRSPRLASSIMNTIMMFMMMLALTSASVTTIGNHGITFMEHRQVQINAGSYHAIMKTGLEPAKDSEKIQHFADHYLDACKNANKMDLGINCQISEVFRLKDRAIKATEMNDDIKPTRQKRAAKKEHGKLVKFFIYLFWDDDDEEEDISTPMGVVKHAVSDFKDIERKLQEAQSSYQKELHATTRQIQEEEGRIFTSINKQLLRERIRNLEAISIENIHGITDAYENIQNFRINKEELMTIVKRINSELKIHEIPRLTPKQLGEITTSKLSMEKGELIVTLNFPIVFTEVYKTYFAVPTPSNKLNLIANFTPHDVTVCEKTNTFINEVDLLKINKTFAITTSTNIAVMKVTQTDDCVIMTLFENGHTCDMERIEEAEERWTFTPVDNLIFFISPQKELVCGETRRKIIERTGLIILNRTCIIETPTRIIRPAQDTSERTIRKAIVTEITTEEISISTIRPTSITTQNATIRIDDSDLDEVIKEADEIQNNWRRYKAEIILAIVVFLTLGGLVTYCCLKKQKRPEPRPTGLAMTQYDDSWMKATPSAPAGPPSLFTPETNQMFQMFPNQNNCTHNDEINISVHSTIRKHRRLLLF
jgi:hypothetical protein